MPSEHPSQVIMAESGIRVRHAMSDDAEALSAFAAAVFPLGGPADADPRDLAQYVAKELTAECFRKLTESPNAILLVAAMADRICGYTLVLRSSEELVDCKWTIKTFI